MTTTPLWLTLVVAALGPGSALFGVWLTQRRADKRDDATFVRELARERERWQREDQARTFENRRVAYAEFYESLRKTGVRIHDHGYGLSDDQDEEGRLPADWQLDAWEKLQYLEIYASLRVSQLARNAYDTMYRWGDQARHDVLGTTHFDNEDVADAAKALLLTAIRADLKVPDGPEATESAE